MLYFRYNYTELTYIKFSLFSSKNGKMTNTDKKRKLTESPDHGYATEDSMSKSPEVSSSKWSSVHNRNCT
jgi:hypothetical protein